MDVYTEIYDNNTKNQVFNYGRCWNSTGKKSLVRFFSPVRVFGHGHPPRVVYTTRRVCRKPYVLLSCFVASFGAARLCLPPSPPPSLPPPLPHLLLLARPLLRFCVSSVALVCFFDFDVLIVFSVRLFASLFVSFSFQTFFKHVLFSFSSSSLFASSVMSTH